MKNKLFFLLFFIHSILSAQIVNIPDSGFKTYLVGNSAINTNGDGEIQVSEAISFTGEIALVGEFRGVKSLTGIEAFTALTSLDCSHSYLTRLDLSSNTALTNLDCSTNLLTSLDLSSNTALKKLDCSLNKLTRLNISTNTALTELNCHLNRLTSLDVSANTALTVLDCEINKLTSLNVSTNTALIDLNCARNKLTSLNVSTNTALTVLDCEINKLTSLNVSTNTALKKLDCSLNKLTSLNVSTNTALTSLSCSDNKLTSLNVSTNTALASLSCSDNKLTSLNIANGNNTNFLLVFMTSNKNLKCIQVDANIVGTLPNNWYKDLRASYSTSCLVKISTITIQGQGGGATITNMSSLQMEASVFPSTATDKTYTWSVTNGTGQATIDSKGLLTASANGYVTVTATANDGSGVSGSTVITIINKKYTLTTTAMGGTITINPSLSNGKYPSGTLVVLTAIPSLGFQFSGWSGDISETSNPVTITMDSDKNIKANFIKTIEIPNVFSPNGDGINDTWVIKNISLFPKNHIEIFNRWGTTVYSKTNYQNTWDGKATSKKTKLPTGTYFYIINLYKSEISHFQGWVYIVY